MTTISMSGNIGYSTAAFSPLAALQIFNADALETGLIDLTQISATTGFLEAQVGDGTTFRLNGTSPSGFDNPNVNDFRATTNVNSIAWQQGGTTLFSLTGVDLPFEATATVLDAAIANGTFAATFEGYFGLSLANNFTGSNSAVDTFYGFDGNDVIDGRGGNDILYGNVGEDNISGGSGSDVLYGGQGLDAVNGGSGSDVIYGNVDNDVLTGGDGSDQLFGGQNDDVLYGNADNDNLAGGVGNDVAYGGSGNDNVSGNGGNDAVYGGQGNDNVNGNDGNDYVAGNAGDDNLSGGAGNDTLYGGGDDDTLNGGSGSDEIRGNEGDDVLTGGSGADNFYYGFNTDLGTDTITDFGAGDTLFINAGGESIELVFDADTGQTVVRVEVPTPPPPPPPPDPDPVGPPPLPLDITQPTPAGANTIIILGGDFTSDIGSSIIIT